MLSFRLFDASDATRLRLVVTLSAPRRALDLPAGNQLLYFAELAIGPFEDTPRKIYGLSPIECLALALATLDAQIRLEHTRAPLRWDDGRAYGGDFDMPVAQLLELHSVSARRAAQRNAARDPDPPGWPP